jgi:hypothetical protein
MPANAPQPVFLFLIEILVVISMPCLLALMSFIAKLAGFFVGKGPSSPKAVLAQSLAELPLVEPVEELEPASVVTLSVLHEDINGAIAIIPRLVNPLFKNSFLSIVYDCF